MPSRDDPVLSVDRLKTQFDAYSGIVDRARSILQGETKVVRAVDDVSIDIGTNEVHGVIGESGCGKTTFINTIIGLVEPTEGEIAFDGKPLGEFTKENWKAYRRRVQLIFQDPYNSLDPKMKVGGILSEPLRIHDIPYDESKLLEVLRDVELTPPRRYFDKRPSQLSGGERQRVSIARALIMQPDLILADEPVSMLDVSTQAAILKLISKLIDEREMSMIYISHDLSTVSYICDSINVMYLGRFVETGPTRRILDEPKHPYTQALINAIPHPNPDFERKRTEISGSPGDAVNLPTGCRFKDRCPERMDVCDIQPESVSVDDGKHHTVACHLYYDHMDQASARAQDAAELEGSD